MHREENASPRLAIIISVIVFCLGLGIGYTMSMAKHYQKGIEQGYDACMIATGGRNQYE